MTHNKDKGTSVGFSNAKIGELIIEKVEQLNQDGSRTDITYRYNKNGLLKPEYAAIFDKDENIFKNGSYYYDLFKFFSDSHNLILLDSEIEEIIEQVKTFKNKYNDVLP